MLHVPNITKNLLSVSSFAKDNGVFFEFQPCHCFVKDLKSKEILLEGRIRARLYEFNLNLDRDKTGLARTDNGSIVNTASSF